MKDYGVPEEVLQEICETFYHHLNPVVDGRVRIDVVHQHDAINYSFSGSIKLEDGDYGFIIQDGNFNGTVVEEWGKADDVGMYIPPEPSEPMSFVPIDPNLPKGLQKVYLKWRKEPWFKEKEGGYNYDRHFAPGGKTEEYYKKWAATRGLKPGLFSEYKAEIARQKEHG